MGRIDEKTLKAQIKEESFSRAYFIFGDEDYLKELCTARLLKKLATGPLADFNLHRFDGKQCSLDDVLRDADLLPMMGGVNVVVCNDYPFDKSEKDCKAIKEYLADAPETTVLIFSYEAVSPDIKKSNRWKGVEAAFAKYGSSIQLNRKSQSELIKLIISACKKRGAEISTAAANYLISVSGNDIKALLSEANKLSAYSNGGEITREMIDSLAVKSLSARVYDLSNAVVRSRYDDAFKILDFLFATREDPSFILSAAANCFVDMYRVKCARAAGEAYQNITQYYSYGNRFFALDNAARDSRNLSVEQLRRCLDVIMKADNDLKSTSLDEKLVFEEMLVKLLIITKGA